MSFDWVIGIPAWGGAYVEPLFSTTLPAIKAAMSRTSGSFRFVFVTDDRQSIGNWMRANMPDCQVDYLPLSIRLDYFNVGNTRYMKLGDAVHALLDAVKIGECAALLMADEIISNDWFSASEKYFNKGKNLIVLYGGGRSYGDPPIGADPRELRRWAWDHRHSWIKQCTWNGGNSLATTVLFFEKDGTVVCRGFHIHTHAAFRKVRPMSFSTVTGDAGQGGLAETNFGNRREEIAMLTGPDEMGYAELTRSDMHWPTGKPLSIERLVYFSKSMTEWDWWLFSHRFHIIGDGDPGDREICDEIMRQAAERRAVA